MSPPISANTDQEETRKMVKSKRSFLLDSGSTVFGIMHVCAVPIGTKEALFVSGFLSVC